MPEVLTTSSRTAINSLLRLFWFFFYSFVFLGFLFSFIMAHCKYYFEILFYVTFAFIKEKKIYNNKKKEMKSLYHFAYLINAFCLGYFWILSYRNNLLLSCNF